MSDSEEKKVPTAIMQIRKAWEAAGKKPPPDAEGKKLVVAYKTIASTVQDLEEKLAKAQASEYEAVEALAKAYGGRSLRIDGVVHDFACRGDKIFFRRKGTGEIVDL